MAKGNSRNRENGESRGAKPLAPPGASQEDGSPAKPLGSQQQMLVVGIGASAGGLEALERFFDFMPASSGMAFVVIQHLSPDFKSLMDELLARHTEMAIHRVEDGMLVEPNSIYLIPPKKNMRIKDGRLVLTAQEDHHGLNLPIDAFFESLAVDCRDRAVGVVLSGSGSDGSRGVEAIHRAGGLVIVQHPQSAKFDSMPQAAIGSRVANFILTPDEMAETLIRHLARPYPCTTAPEVVVPPIAKEGELADVFALLLQRYEIDFSHYKPTTVIRRIHRRVELSGAANLDDFVVRLATDPGELNRLYKDLLIGVTQFFRDNEAFEALQRNVLPALLANKDPDDEIRIWDAGCATGEETYSLAILVLESLQDMQRPPVVKIFATDVHRDSLEFAGVGSYDGEAVAGVRASRLGKFFSREGDHRWRISQEVRKTVVFAPHNVVKDAPFTRMDLVVCRNLLIYFQPEVQQRVLTTFQYALNVGGALMLGPSESVGEAGDDFETIDGHWKLYRKVRDARPDSRLRMPLVASVLRPREMIRAPKPFPIAAAAPSSRLLRAYDALLAESIPASILVDDRYEVAHIFGDARRFLHPPAGRPTNDVLNMVDDNLRVALAAALQRASKDQRQVTYDAVPLRDYEWTNSTSRDESPAGHQEVATGPAELLAKLTVRPIVDRQQDSSFYLISFQTRVAPPQLSQPEDKFDSAEISVERISSLESELAYTRESLQATVEELQTSNEELQATNEELVASNEELQSTNEELHSVNEELHTVNSEYQKKIDELTQLTADMDHLLLSTEVGVIYLDLNLRIRKFTPAVAELFSLLPQDIGRPIHHISGCVKFEELGDDVQRVLETGATCEREVRSGDIPFLLRILPYHEFADKVQGVVLTFIEIRKLKEAEQQARETGELYHSLFEAAPCGFVKLDRNGIIMMVNVATERLFGYQREELIGQPVAKLMPEAGREVFDVHSTLTQDPAPGQTKQTSNVDAVRKDGSKFPAEIGLTSLDTPSGYRLLAWIIDITDRKRLEDQKDRLLDAAFAATATQSAPADDSGRNLGAKGITLGSPTQFGRGVFAKGLEEFARQVRLLIGTHQAAINYIPQGDFTAAYHVRSLSMKYEQYARYNVTATGEGIWKLVLHSKQPVCMTQSQVESHPFWTNFGDRKDKQGLAHPPMRGWLAVPILGSETNDIIGMLQFSDKYEGDFTDEDVETAKQLCQLISPILELQFVNDRIQKIVEERTNDLAHANEELARSNAELEQFAYIASHDLQEPLRKIVSYCQLLREEKSDRLDEEGLKYIDVAVNGAKRLQALVQDLLLYSRVGTRGRPLAPTDTNVSLEQALSNLEMTIQEKAAKITADPLPRAMADQSQLTQLFQNLIGNAIKYCNEPTPTIHVGVRDLGAQYEFSVQDNGIGIAPENYEKVFQIFQRLHSRQQYSGTGIGLALCRRIVERFGGEIWVDSTVGDGTTFYFKLSKQGL